MIPRSFVRNTDRGFTLVETLIYIALFGIILTGVITSAYPLITGAEKLSQRVVEESEAAFIFSKIEWAFNESPVTDINESNPSELRIIKGSDSIYFRDNAGVMEISVNGGAWEPITATRAVFSGLDVVLDENPIVPGAPHTVMVSFSLGGETYSETFNVYF